MALDASRSPDSAVLHVLGLMQQFARVRVRAMFGGHGLYREDLMFALMADGRLFLKVDAQSLPLFAKLNLRAFTFEARGRAVQLSYREAPSEALDDELTMRQWCELAWQAALRAKAGAAQKRGKRIAAHADEQDACQGEGDAMRATALGALPNLGPRSLAWLAAAGITSPSQLRELGAVRAFVRARALNPGVSLTLLWALEGALTGRRWQDVAETDRASLLMALEDVERGAPRVSRPRRGDITC